MIYIYRHVSISLYDVIYIYICHISFIYLSYCVYTIYIYIQGICYKRCFYL